MYRPDFVDQGKVILRLLQHTMLLRPLRYLSKPCRMWLGGTHRGFPYKIPSFGTLVYGSGAMRAPPILFGRHIGGFCTAAELAPPVLISQPTPGVQHLMPATNALTLLRSNEKTSAWIDYLEQIDPPPGVVSIPDGDDFMVAMVDLEIPFDAMGTLEALRSKIADDPDLMWIVEKCVQSLRLHMDMIDEPPSFPTLPEELGDVGRYFYAFVYMAMLPHTKQFFLSRRISHEIANATLADVGRHFTIYHAQHGIGGMAGQDWLKLHARGMIFQLGRLQFERARLGNRTSLAMQAAGLDVTKGEHVLSVHIPGFMGPFPPEVCDASFAQAREFFATHFPEEPFRHAVCHSWLLDEQLADYLPETSNIVQFQRRFRPAYRPEANNHTTLEFVFRTPNRPLDELPQNTTLERAAVRHIKDGKQWHGGTGWLEL